MKFELKTENENYSDSFSHILIIGSFLALIIIFFDLKSFWAILLVKNVLHSIIRKNFASKYL